MRAAWYDAQGPAAEVLQVGELPDPEPGPGEVAVRLRLSGVNPGDTKKRLGWLGSSMAFPRVVPHSDGAGVVAAVGEGVDPARVGRRAWVFGAQSYRPSGTAAQLTVVPSVQAVDLPDDVPDEVGACLGIPGTTAHRTVFADGPVAGRTVLVHGVLGAVGSLAAQLAARGGARVVGTVRRAADLERVAASPLSSVLAAAVALDGADVAREVLAHADGRVDRIVEVAFSENIDLDTAVIGPDGTIAAYGTRRDRPELPFWPLLFANVTVRLFGSDDFPPAAKTEAAAELTAAAHEGRLWIPVGDPVPLEQVAQAHDRVDAGSRDRVVVALPD
ncbi:NADPH:quinone reductase [Kineococcus rubinsiae]|uniref:NADPH:quinone reductase n=1 Tax=Kineococcus rubinsiae TaxID=2609562 RepID=UPI00142F7859|nr:NADPH:quinone reductase [Kineococcus rubinsiae]NIZ92839.1 NADPH:quinone reductase [Kineococcus rubinsiae]